MIVNACARQRTRLHSLVDIASCHVRRNVAADGVAFASGAVRVELTTVVSFRDVDRSQVGVARNLKDWGATDDDINCCSGKDGRQRDGLPGRRAES